MSKHHVFFVHGMGTYSASWAKSLHGQMRGLFEQYKRLDEHKMVRQFEFHSVRYDQVFEAWRSMWATNAKAAGAALVATGLGQGFATELVDLAGSPAGDGFLRTHVLDVLGYRFINQIQTEVQREVENQILSVLDGSTDNITYSIVAHSLGTVVVYETFHAMLTQGGADGTAFPSAFLPHNVFNFANVSKVLWSRGRNRYPAILAPNLAESTGLCFHMANFDHKLDPVSRLGPFEPPDTWFRAGAPRDEVYRDIVLPAADIQDEHVHAFEHYLSHPSVHVHMLRQLTRPGLISDQEERDALVAWRAKTLINEKLAQARAKLKGIGDQTADNWKARVAVLRAVRELARGSQLKGGEK
jgi:hypothetical protein